jgi:hypothetical protein
MAYARVKPIPRFVGAIDLTAMAAAAGATTEEKVVEHFARRFLLVPLGPQSRAAMTDFLRRQLADAGVTLSDRNQKVENALRELLYLVLSTPEYQLG